MLVIAQERHEICRPYGEELLLTPAMADGYDAVPPEELHRLRNYLEAVVSARRSPVHTAVAFNAAYFGYDLDGDGYGGSPLDLDAFPVVTLGARGPALPVGAMMQIMTGSQPLYAEIVYKEGHHPLVNASGDVPGWISGAPAGADGPGRPCIEAAPTRQELLVPDVDAFGPALSFGDAQLNRLRTRERWVDQRGHILVAASYGSPEEARLGDTAAYASYLLGTGRKQLLSPYVPVSIVDLASASDEQNLERTLTALLDVVSRVLASSTVLRMWGPYAMTRESLAACWRDSGPLGGDDMHALAVSVRNAARPMVRRRYALPGSTTAYTAVSPRLRQFSHVEPLLTGVGYATAVCRANVALADVLRGESENGLFEDGVRVGLDDAFESGGVWRSHYPGAAESHRDPLTAAGFGWRSVLRPPADHSLRPAKHLAPRAAVPESGPLTAPDERPADSTPVIPVDGPLAGDTALGPTQDLRISDSEVSWRLPLRLAHLAGGYLPLRPLIADELADLGCDGSLISMELTHPGSAEKSYQSLQNSVAELHGGTGRLRGVTWPPDFFPGMQLHLRWPRGSRLIRATTIRLDAPVVVDGQTLGHCYDDAVLLREGAPGSDRSRDSPVGLSPQDLVLRAVRRCGFLTTDRHALLDRSFLPTVVYGQPPRADQADALQVAVDALFEERRLFPEDGSRDEYGYPHYPPRTHEQWIPLISYRPQPVLAQAARRDVQPDEPPARVSQYFVPGHLRRIGLDGCPGEAQVDAFREHCRQLGKPDGWELPPGYTFVTPHTRSR